MKLLISVFCAFLGACYAEETKEPKGTVLITGANRGLGLEMAKHFIKDHYQVIGTARKPDEAVDLKKIGARVVQLDVTDDESIAAMAAELKGVPIDILINNAGYYGPKGVKSLKAFEETSRDLFLACFEINALGPHFVTRALISNVRLSKAKLPKVINISSRASLLHRKRKRADTYCYGTSKTALNMLTRSAAADFKKENIMVTAVCPGHNRTDMGTQKAPLDPVVTMGMLKELVEGLTIDDAGSLIYYDGTRLDW